MAHYQGCDDPQFGYSQRLTAQFSGPYENGMNAVSFILVGPMSPLIGVSILVPRKRSGRNSAGAGENEAGSRRSVYSGICIAVPSGMYLRFILSDDD